MSPHLEVKPIWRRGGAVMSALNLGVTTMTLLLAATLVLLTSGVQGANAQRAIRLQARQTATIDGQRHALVIGNSEYRSSPLRNPVNDATDLAKTLRRVGFQVTLKLNADRREMRRAIRELGDKLRRGGVGLFFYAGHGMQVNGVNYLIPVGAEIEREDEVPDEAVNAASLLRKMKSAGNPLNMVFLDACRNNPFVRSFRSGAKGLAQMDAPSGSLIVYATAPGSVAADGQGRNSPFTRNLIAKLETPNLELSALMKQVRIGVMADTGNKQTPWDSSSLTANFYFAGLTSQAPPRVANDRSVSQPSAIPPRTIDEEEAFWRAIQSSTATEDFREYLKVYPQGRFAIVARLKIKQLERNRTPSNRPLQDQTAVTEMRHWEAIKNSNSVADFQVYLKTYPNGRFAHAAKIKIDLLGPSRLPSLRPDSKLNTVATPPPGRASPSVERTWQGGAGKVWQVAFSPDGRLAVSASHSNVASLWEVSSGRKLRTFRGHASAVFGAAFTPDGQQVLTGSADKTLKLWEVSSGRELRTFRGHTDRVRGVAISPDGRFALSGAKDGTMRLWNLNTGYNVRTFRGHAKYVRTVQFSPDGRLALSGGQDDKMILWDVNSGQRLRTFLGHTGDINGMAFTPDGARVISASDDRSLRTWDTRTGRNLRTLCGHAYWVYGVALTPDGKSALSASSDDTLKVWDVASGKEFRTLGKHPKDVNTVAISTNGRLALSGSDDQNLKLWDLFSKPLRTGVIPNYPINNSLLNTWCEGTGKQWEVVFSPDGGWAASASHGKTAIIWDVPTGRRRTILKGHTAAVFAIAFTPDGRRVLTGSADRTLKLWDASSGKLIRTYQGHTDRVRGVAISPDGRFALSGARDGLMRLWNLETGESIRTFRGHAKYVRAVQFSPDGRMALSGGQDDKLILWDLNSGRQLRTFLGHSGDINDMAFTPDGNRIISASDDRTLKIWDARTGQEIRTLRGHTYWVYSVAISPNGRLAVSGSSDDTIRIWDLASGRDLGVLGRHLKDVNSVAISPDGRFVLSGSDDKGIKLWKLP